MFETSNRWDTMDLYNKFITSHNWGAPCITMSQFNQHLIMENKKWGLVRKNLMSNACWMGFVLVLLFLSISDWRMKNLMGLQLRWKHVSPGPVFWHGEFVQVGGQGLDGLCACRSAASLRNFGWHKHQLRFLLHVASMWQVPHFPMVSDCHSGTSSQGNGKISDLTSH